MSRKEIHVTEMECMKVEVRFWSIMRNSKGKDKHSLHSDFSDILQKEMLQGLQVCAGPVYS